MKKILALLVFFIAQSFVAQEKVLTALDVAKIEIITNAVISKDGQKITYQKLVPADPTVENVPAKSHLYVYDMATKKTTPFVTGYSASNIKFRPGHSSITFTATRDNAKTSSLYEIPLSGGEAQKLYEFETSISSYDWHSSGTRLAFISSKKKDQTESKLPYKPEIYETDLQTSAVYVTDLSATAPKVVEVEGHVTTVQWSPNGNQIALGAAPSSLVDDFYTSQKILILDAVSLKVTGEINHKAKLGPLKWSPDGKKIAFIAGEDQHDPIDGRLFVADATGGSPKILQKDFKGKFDGLAWKDNNSIYYQASEGVFSSLGTIDMNGKMDRLYKNDDMNITGFSVANNNSIILTANTPQHPDELFVLNSKASTVDRLTTTNPWLTQMKLGKQEVIRYKAQDGLEIEGILIHPVNKTGKTPLITVVHGGPEAHYSNGWLTAYNMPGQLGAGEGYAVFYPNYRGSTGRGIEFAKSSQGDPAGKEFDDIIDGIDHLIEKYDIDRDKVGVTGGSYGGYATAWMATRHTKRFAAGVMSVGISNNISKWGTSDIPEEMYLVHSRKRIWDDYQFYLERSPIFYAHQAETPLLILHGKDDTRVSPGQSYELYRHIKTRTETPVRLVLYPGEGHGNRRSTARYDYNMRMMRWFDTYLKDGSISLPDATLGTDGR